MLPGGVEALVGGYPDEATLWIPACGGLVIGDVVLGGGNAKKLTSLPMGCRMGDNANAFLGGFRLWERARKSALEPGGPR